MAIKHRRGAYKDFDPEKMVAGEIAHVVSGDPSSADGKSIYGCFSAGDVKRLATYEDMEDNIESVTEDIRNEFLSEIEVATRNANAATSKANTAASNANKAAQDANAALEDIKDAVQGTLINDSTPSALTVYSGDKTEALAQPNLLPDYLIQENLGATVSGDAKFENGIITVKASKTGANSAGYIDLQDFFEIGQQYTITCRSTKTGTSGGGMAVQERDEENAGNNSISGGSDSKYRAVTFTPSKRIIRIVFWNGTSSAVKVGDTSTFSDIMLVKGSAAAVYTPDAKTQSELLAQINQRTAKNLFDYANPDHFVARADGIVGINKITVKATAINAVPYIGFSLKNYLEKNKDYTLSFKSTRKGETGGGAYIVGSKDGSFTTIKSFQDTLNAIATFNTGDYDYVQINFVATNIAKGGAVGDSATFTDVMLVEGDFPGFDYVPYDTTKSDIALMKSTLGYECKNLIPYPYDETTKTNNGITFTDVGDGAIKVNGTCTATENNYAFMNIQIRSDKKNPFILKKGKYILTGCPAGGGNKTYQFSCGYTNTSDGTSYADIGRENGDGLEFELNQDIDTMQVSIIVRPGVTVNNLVFRPMIRRAEIKDDTWEAYKPSVEEQIEQINTDLEKIRSHVGMIVQSTTLDTEAKVKAIYGGTTWTKIEGRFLLGASSAYAVNSAGGNDSHAHVTSMGFDGGTIFTWHDESGAPVFGSTVSEVSRGAVAITSTPTPGAGRFAHTQESNHMPPYKTVYIWERTA